MVTGTAVSEEAFMWRHTGHIQKRFLGGSRRIGVKGRFRSAQSYAQTVSYPIEELSPPTSNVSCVVEYMAGPQVGEEGRTPATTFKLRVALSLSHDHVERE